LASEPAPKVIIVRPPSPSEDVARLEMGCRARAHAEGLPVRIYAAESVATEWARKVRMLEPAHAAALYRALHREAVLVLAFTAIWIRRDPRRDRPVKRVAVKLETFVEHKAVHRLVRDDRAIGDAFDDYAAWCRSVHCSGEDDARVLPLHVFETSRQWSHLGTSAGDLEFAQCYGPARAREDEGRKTWARAARGAYHGGEPLRVAGQMLAQGMHWDVSIRRGSALVCSADRVWQLRGRNAFVNIHPDGHVRPTKSSRRLWPDPAKR
jgi:hypothetical protein